MDFANYWFSSAAGGGGYEVGNSLRFRPSSGIYMSNSVNSAPTTSTAATISFWLKRGRSAGGFKIFDCRDGGTDWGFNAFIPYNAGFAWGDSTFGSAENATGVTNYWTLNQYPSQPALRDYAAWYHIVLQWDSNNGTSTRRQRIWVNGNEYDFYNYYGSIGSGRSCPWTRNGYTFKIGDGSTPEFIIAEAHCVDGQVLNPTNFAEYNSDNVWVPKEVTGVTYGNNGWYLDFSDPANIGTDRSGQGNNFTATGFELSNTGSTNYDWLNDSPTRNYCTFSPLDRRAVVGGTSLEKNNMTAQNSSTTAYGGWYSTQAIDPANDSFAEANLQWGGTTYTWQFYLRSVDGSQAFRLYNENSGATIQYNGSTQTTTSRFNNGDEFGMRCTNGTVRFYRNGSQIYQFSQTLTSPAQTFILTSWNNREHWTWGQRPYINSNPTSGAGDEHWCTANMPDVDVPDPSTCFKAVTYAGNSSARSINVGFQPDLVWIKAYNINGADHVWTDSGRGATKVLRSNLANSQYTQTDSLTGFTSTGFNLGSDTSGGPSGNFNLSGRNFVAWSWKKQSGVFDVVTYSGTNSAQSISHNLGAVPALMIIKADNATSSWQVYHQSLGNQAAMFLDQTSNGTRNDNSRWNSTSPTSTAFTVGTDGGMNGSGRNFVAYLWAEVPGFSSIGTYTGNGNSDGAFVYTGFRPAFLIYKTITGTTDNWFTYDSTRDDRNPAYKALRADTAINEKTSTTDIPIDLLSNGFKMRFSGTAGNGNNQQYLYIAFAEHPFGGGNVNPSPAR